MNLLMLVILHYYIPGLGLFVFKMFSESFMRKMSPGNIEKIYTIHTEAFMQYFVQRCTLSTLQHAYFG